MSQKKFTIDADTIQVQSGTSQAGKDYQITKFKVTDGDGNEFDADAYGDKAAQVKEVAANGTVTARVVDDVFSERDNTDIVVSAKDFKGKTTWKFKFPFVKGGGFGGGGGGKWQGKGGYSGGGGGGKYRGKPLEFNAYLKFCQDLFSAAAGTVAKAFPNITAAEQAAVAQSTHATWLIGMQENMAYPDGCAPAAPSQVASQGASQPAASGDTQKATTPDPDMSIPEVKAYMLQIATADSSETLDILDQEIIGDKALAAMQRIALRQKVAGQRKALDL